MGWFTDRWRIALAIGVWWLALIGFGQGTAQADDRHELDSLHQQLRQSTPSVAVVDGYLNLASHYIVLAHADSVQYCLNEAERLATQIHYARGRYFALTYQAELLDQNALYDEALRYAFRTLAEARRIGDAELLGNAEMVLGLIYNDAHNPNEAIRHLKRSLPLLPARSHQPHDVARGYHALNNLSQCYIQLKKYVPAIQYAQRAIGLARSEGSYRGQTIGNWNLGRAWFAQKKYEQARQDFQTGLQNALVNKDWDGATLIYPWLFQVYQEQQQPQLARQMLREGWQILAQHPEQLSVVSRLEFYRELVAAFRKVGDYKTVADVQQKLMTLREKTDQQANNQRLALQRTVYEQEEKYIRLTEKSRLDAERLARNRQNNVLLWSLFGLLVTLVGVGWYALRQRQVLQTLRLRDQLARDLHDDLGGHLSGLSFYGDAARNLHEQGRYDEVLPLIEQMTHVARDTAKQMSDVVWSMRTTADSVPALANQLTQFGQSLLTPLGITLTVETDPALNCLILPPNVLRNLYLIGKESLHNAAKYASATEVTLRITLNPTVGSKSRIYLRVSDNGCGFDPATVLAGNGLSSMTQRATAIGGQLQLSSEPGQGTLIAVAW